MASCKKDFLAVDSTNQLTLDNFFTSYQECRNATAPLYHSAWYQFSGTFYYYLGDGRGGNLFTPYSSAESFLRFTESSELPILVNAFQSLYIVVTQADYVINNIDKALEHHVPEAQVNACRAEAKFMRGLAYWYLASLWGNVPVIQDPAETASNFRVNSNRFEDVMLYAIRDLEYAAAHLPPGDSEPGRVTRSSANAALARVFITAACMARGSKFSDNTTTADDYYEKARVAAKSVIDDARYKLMDDYEQLFRVQNNNNSESLFALQFVPGSSTYGTGNRAQDNIAFSTDITGGLNAWGGSMFVGGDLVQLMHNRGELSRKKATFFYPGATYTYLGAHTPAGQWTVSTSNGYRYPNIKKGVVGGPKDTDGSAINGNSGMAVPMIRLAEVYLLYAEAILGTNSSTTDGEALLYFNKVRERADINPVAEITLAELWDERRCELAMEGQFWFDIVRRAYWDEAWAINFMNSQRRSEYYYYLSNTAPNGFAWRDISDGQTANPATADKLLLPYPATELVMNPLLREDPVPFDFSTYK